MMWKNRNSLEEFNKITNISKIFYLFRKNVVPMQRKNTLP